MAGTLSGSALSSSVGVSVPFVGELVRSASGRANGLKSDASKGGIGGWVSSASAAVLRRGVVGALAGEKFPERKSANVERPCAMVR